MGPPARLGLGELVVSTKYHNRKTKYAGQVYDSAAEARRAQELDLLKAAGQVKEWRRPERVIVWMSGQDRITYRPDFLVYGADGHAWFEDVKGVQTEAFRIKAKLFRSHGFELRVIPAGEVRGG